MIRISPKSGNSPLSAKVARRGKYNAQPQVVDGVKFASKKEAREDGFLLTRLRAKEIKALRRQPSYPIKVNGVKVCSYRADWEYLEWQESHWQPVIHDAKGVRTPMFNLKWKLMQALYPGYEYRLS